MNYKHILITGGAGFVGSNIAMQLRNLYSTIDITVLDNLKRRGSELSISRLTDQNIKFVHGDIRNKEDFEGVGTYDLMIECSAEPSVLAGVNESPEYLLNTNLVGAVNCFESCRNNASDIIFLSTSRVYPINSLNNIDFKESDTRFDIMPNQKIQGLSENGISEDFLLNGARSLYGATKLSSEIILQEYFDIYGIKGVINRCGVITGPWQMGKIDQGVIVLWIARHIWKDKPLSYIGYGGTGKQVRDFIHIDDLFNVVHTQIKDMDRYTGETFNIGGGLENSLSLFELTKLCEKMSGNHIEIKKELKDRPNDVRIYLSDTSKFQKKSDWKCQHNAEKTISDIYRWIIENKSVLERILN